MNAIDALKQVKCARRFQQFPRQQAMFVLINGNKKESSTVDDESNFPFFNHCRIFSLLKRMPKMRDCEKRIQKGTKLGAGTIELVSLICLEKGVLRTHSIRKNARDYFEEKD